MKCSVIGLLKSGLLAMRFPACLSILTKTRVPLDEAGLAVCGGGQLSGHFHMGPPFRKYPEPCPEHPRTVFPQDMCAHFM